MRAAHLRAWARVHTWSSLVCTAFLLVLCVSGLPLLFSDEIDHWLDPSHPLAAAPGAQARASLDPMVRRARELRPDAVVVSLSIDPRRPRVRVNTAASVARANADPGSIQWLAFDARSGDFIGDSTRAPVSWNRTEQFFLDLHSRLLLGDAGLAVMGVMGTLFVVALVSGVALYGPFMRRLPFGTVRRRQSAATRRLDVHNLLGILACAWMLVVGATGVLNELNDPLFEHWTRDVVAPAAARWGGAPLEPMAPLCSVQQVLADTRRLLPGMNVVGIDYPGVAFNSPRHYMAWANGRTPATEQIFTPVLIDALDCRLTAVLPMPWYLRAVEVSRPFHFGDYGGLPLKLIWALFDGVTIIVLATGLQLYARRIGSGRA